MCIRDRFRIVMCWYAFHRLRHSFAFGRAIASDHRLIGGTIVITTVTSGSRFKTYGRVKRFLKNAFARTKFDALEQFRRLVRTQMVLIDKERTLRGGTSRQASGLHRAVGGFRYVRRTAKVKDYDEASGLHTIYYRDDEKKTRERVDLAAGGIGIGHVRGILDANAIDVAEVLSEAGGAGGLAEQAAFITGTGHGALDCGARVDREEGKAGGQR